MDNVRNVIEMLFAERDVREVLDSYNECIRGGNGIKDDVFKKLFLNKYFHYSGNQLNSLFDITNDEWVSKPWGFMNLREQKSVFNLLVYASKQMLMCISNAPYCRYSQYLRWNELTRYIGEDLLVTAYLAARDIANNYDGRNSWEWGRGILSTNVFLNECFKKGLSELHSHLYGSSLIFTVNWLALMNNPEYINEDNINKFTQLGIDLKLIFLASFLRAMLYKMVNRFEDKPIDSVSGLWFKKSNKYQWIDILIEKVPNFINRLKSDGNPMSKDYCIDYAIPKGLTSCTRCLVGERRLLYMCFKRVFTKCDDKFSYMFYLYLLIKSKFRKIMIQENKIIGFENFQTFNCNCRLYKRLLTNDERVNACYDKELESIAINIETNGLNVKYIEHRVSPQTNIQYISSFIESDRDKHKYILHFFKSKERDGFYRHCDLREMVLNQAYEMESDIESVVSQIVGVDAAGNEFNCRPEVFGPVFRKLKSCGQGRLGRTYHVGEDFYDIVDGLRAVDEALRFLELEKGNRIGHGTVLGIDAHRYYENIHYTVVMPKQVLLDNLAWILYKIGYNKRCLIPMYAHEMYKKCEQLFKEIYGGTFNLRVYIRSWHLRGDYPELYKSGRFEYTDLGQQDQFKFKDENYVNKAREDSNAVNLYYKYNFCSNVRENGCKPVEWKIGVKYRSSFVEILEIVQKMMLKEIKHKGIAIECCPTSNLRIGNIPTYSQHPIVKFSSKGLRLRGIRCLCSCGNPNITVSINTDDAGIFDTSLEKEYTLMAIALSKEVDKSGKPKYNIESIYKWLDNIRENAFIQKFGK